MLTTWDGLRLRAASGGAQTARKVFNGLNISQLGGTFTGGPVAALDHEGILRPGALNVPTIEGARWDAINSVWTPYDTDGSLLYPATTRRGIIEFTDADPTQFKRMVIEPGRTNKCTCQKANPVDTTNVVKSGNVLAVLSVVDDSAALAAAGLDKICTSGKVYKLDNSAGTTNAFATCFGSCGNTSVHSFRVYCRVSVGSGLLYLSTTAASHTVLSSSTYVRAGKEGITPATVGDALAVRADVGAIVYFILPQLEEGPYATSPIFRDSTGADPLTSLTRQATVASFPTAGVLRGNNLGGREQVIPGAAGVTGWIWNSYADANKGCGVLVSPTSITFRKRAGGTNTDATVNYTHVAGTPFQIDWYQALTGMGIRYRAWGGATWGAWSAFTEVTTDAGKADMIVASTFQRGSRNSLEQWSGNIQYDKPYWNSNIKSYLEAA